MAQLQVHERPDARSVGSTAVEGRRVCSGGNGDNRAAYWSKRCLDMAICLISLPLMMLIWLPIALAIAIDSRGPVIFSQERVGARRLVVDGAVVWETRVFRVHKFRSMVHNADEGVHREHIKNYVRGDVEVSGEDDAQFKLVDDPRVTRVGRFLRRTSLDELPQIANILMGEMSIVGPRPVPVYEVEEYRERDFERLAALPGLTGLWQVTGRGNVTFEEMVALDIEYVRTRNLWLDIQLIVRTIPAVVASRGAR